MMGNPEQFTTEFIETEQSDAYRFLLRDFIRLRKNAYFPQPMPLWTSVKRDLGGLEFRPTGCRGRAQILDEKHLIAAFVVDELIHEMEGQEDSESSRTQTGLFANGHVPNRIVRRIVDRGMMQFIQRKPFAGIFDATGYRLPCAQI
jgi:hypothetical protein